MAPPRLSVIVSTFDRPGALRLAIEGIRESAGAIPLEVVVADDGSGPETREVVDRLASRAGFPVLHARQEHAGFRLAAVRNLAVRSSRGEVLVFLDGDCIVHPRALALHSARARPGRALCGARVFLGPGETSDLLEGRRVPAEVAGPAYRRAAPLLLGRFVRNLFYRSLRLKPRPKLVAGNCSVHRSDFERVNGFDERFLGWGYEDDDLARRLRRAGVRIRDGTRDCLALHLFHPVHPSHRPDSRETANYRYYRRGVFLTRCRRGLSPLSLEDLSYEVLGSPPPDLRPLVDRLAGNGGDAPGNPQVTLDFSGPPRGRPRGEVRLRVPDEVLQSGPEQFRTFLEDAL
jgi:glycosyltransferase involved in cell wall biosynthesis